MTTKEKLIRCKLSILELAEYLKNVSQACKINGVSRQHFYDIKKAYDEHGMEGLKENTRRKPCEETGSPLTLDSFINLITTGFSEPENDVPGLVS